MDSEVQAFEESILYFADAYNLHGPGSQPQSPAPYINSCAIESGATTPALSAGSSAPSSRASSFAASNSRRPSFGQRLSNILSMTAVPESNDNATFEDPVMEEQHEEIINQETAKDKLQRHELAAWQLEAAEVDRAVQILPGVKRMMDSIPKGKYAVATSGAKTYGSYFSFTLSSIVFSSSSFCLAYGCMTRVGITPPEVTITADDKRLKKGKPFPDPFLLAAECLGYDAKKCVVFEDSPSGIRAGVASGATVIAVCTSHERSKIENCGAHYIVENMEKVHCNVVDGKLEFTVTA